MTRDQVRQCISATMREHTDDEDAAGMPTLANSGTDTKCTLALALEDQFDIGAIPEAEAEKWVTLEDVLATVVNSLQLND